jgi:hypothetical protein
VVNQEILKEHFQPFKSHFTGCAFLQPQASICPFSGQAGDC